MVDSPAPQSLGNSSRNLELPAKLFLSLNSFNAMLSFLQELNQMRRLRKKRALVGKVDSIGSRLVCLDGRGDLGK